MPENEREKRQTDDTGVERDFPGTVAYHTWRSPHSMPKSRQTSLNRCSVGAFGSAKQTAPDLKIRPDTSSADG